MTNDRKCKVQVNGQEIQYVEEFSNLGQLASLENKQVKKIDNA